LLFTNQGQKLSIPFGHGTTGQSKAKVVVGIIKNEDLPRPRSESDNLHPNIVINNNTTFEEYWQKIEDNLSLRSCFCP